MTQASIFVKEMMEIWDGKLHHLYDAWHNARKRAEQAYGAKRLYSNIKGGESGYTYQFPDGSKVWIHSQGKACWSRKCDR